MFRLRRSIYGLRGTARIWNNLLFQILESCNLREMDTALCVFFGGNAILLCYVDDLLLLAADDSTLSTWYRELGKQFWVNDLGIPKQFLGLNVSYEPDG